MRGDKTGSDAPPREERGQGLGLKRIAPSPRMPAPPRPVDAVRAGASARLGAGPRIKAPARAGPSALGIKGDEPLPFEPRHDDERLTVGTGILLKGEVSACERLVVHGRIEATLSDSNMLLIAESGAFQGDAVVAEADISGRFAGSLTVSGRLTVRATGRVLGTVRYDELEIERGGRLAGDIHFAADQAPPAEEEQDMPLAPPAPPVEPDA